jgi:hypothetical protein
MANHRSAIYKVDQDRLHQKEHKIPASRHRDQKESKEGIGLLALGSSGPWEVAIDETMSGPARYFAQIEGPALYLYFEIPTIELIEDVLDFLVVHESGAMNLVTTTVPRGPGHV